MLKYVIKKAYPWTTDLDIKITSDKLQYSEFGKDHAGLQCYSKKNILEIHKRCREIAYLIREIEILNQ